MKFSVRLALGTVLFLLCCWSLETTRLENVDSKSSENKAKKINQNWNLTNGTANQTEKTEIRNDNKVNGIKLQKSEPYKKNNKSDKEEEDETLAVAAANRRNDEIIGRSFDVEKYYSNDFHNKNNIYNLTVSKDTEKFINPDFEFHHTVTAPVKESTSSINSHYDKSIDSIELTTPKTPIFDNKYQETVDSVEQKLEHIDDDSSESFESNSKESSSINLDKMLNATRTNDTNANLNYTKYKNLISNKMSPNNNSIHKDNVVEFGTQLNFQSAFNNTKIIDDVNDERLNNTIVKEIDKSEVTTFRNVPLTTSTSRKIILLKPRPSKSPILSNKIEQDTVAVKAIPEKSSKGQAEVVEDVNTKRSPIDISKRGSVKFSDYTRVPTTLRPKVTTRKEELVQENQIVPVSVEAPKNLNKSESGIVESPTTVSSINVEQVTTTRSSTTTRPEDDVLTTTIILPETTTQSIFETTDALTTTTDSEDLTTTQQAVETTTTDEGNVMTTTVLADETTTLDSMTTTTTSQTTTFLPNNEQTTDWTTTEDLLPETTETPLRVSKGFVFYNASPTEPATTEVPTTTTEIVPTTEIVTNIPTTTEIIEETTTTKLWHVDPKIVANHPESTTFQPEVPITDHVEPIVEVQTTNSPEINGNNESATIKTDDGDTTTDITTQSESDELNRGGDGGDNGGTIAAIVISSIGAVCLILLAGLLVIMRKRQKRFNYGQRCTPVSLDDYSMDNVSVYNSVRRKGLARSSKRSYGNPAFEDPVSVSHPLNFPALGKFANNYEDMKAEFEEIPQITARTNELPEGCDTKNRYANVIPLPETRVFLTPIDGYPNSDYINANYVTGPKNTKGYYIACQAPMQSTVDDFWRMIWEQQSKVILMLTHHFENGVEKCADYLPPSEVLDCHRLFGDFQVTLKKREVKDKYVISILQLKNMVSNSWREVTHFWYMGWPEKGVPSEANSLIAFLIEARSYMKTSSIDRKEVTNGNVTNSNGTKKLEINPVVVHCSPGTGRTGVVIACDIAIREFEQTRLVDVPRIVYKIRRDRASAVQTKEQYIFIYKVINLYATKLTGGALDSL